MCADASAVRMCPSLRVKLQGGGDVVLKICVDVVEQVLQLLDSSRGEKLSSLRFGPTYFGTSRVERVVLVNRGPEASDWVALLQDDAIGTEVVGTRGCAHSGTDRPGCLIGSKFEVLTQSLL